MKSFISFSLLSLFVFSPLHAADDVEGDRFFDRISGSYFYYCGKDESGKILVAEYCGRSWKKYTRDRKDLNKIVKEYKDMKSGDHVMMLVSKENDNKEKVSKWVLGTVSTMYEDGTIGVMEYSSHHGFNPGTLNYKAAYQNLSKLKDTSEKVMCAKESMVIIDGNYNEKSYNLDKGEKITVKESYDNGYVSFAFQGALINLARYGHDNKLPILASQIEPCKDDPSVDNTSRGSKPAESATPAQSPTGEGSTIQR